MMIKVRKEVNGKNYQILALNKNGKDCVYTTFFISLDGKLILQYELGITLIALLIYNAKNEFKPTEFLFDTGLIFITEMLNENDFSRSNGIITSHEMSKTIYNWRNLKELNIDIEYHQ